MSESSKNDRPELSDADILRAGFSLKATMLLLQDRRIAIHERFREMDFQISQNDIQNTYTAAQSAARPEGVEPPWAEDFFPDRNPPSHQNSDSCPSFVGSFGFFELFFFRIAPMKGRSAGGGG